MVIHPTHFPLHLFPVSSQHVFFYSRGKHQQHCLLLGCEDWVLVYKASGLRMHCTHMKSHYYSHDLEKPLRSSWKSPVLTMAVHWKKFFFGGCQLLGKNLKKKSYKEGKIYLDSWFEDRRSQSGKESVVPAAWGSSTIVSPIRKKIDR